MKEETKQGQTKEEVPRTKKAYKKPELTKHDSLRAVTQGICAFGTCAEPGG